MLIKINYCTWNSLWSPSAANWKVKGCLLASICAVMCIYWEMVAHTKCHLVCEFENRWDHNLLTSQNTPGFCVCVWIEVCVLISFPSLCLNSRQSGFFFFFFLLFVSLNSSLCIYFSVLFVSLDSSLCIHFPVLFMPLARRMSVYFPALFVLLNWNCMLYTCCNHWIFTSQFRVLLSVHFFSPFFLLLFAGYCNINVPLFLCRCCPCGLSICYCKINVPLFLCVCCLCGLLLLLD